jgi:pimeloyl-ACP methyl ester carboxylesterase
MEEQKTHVLHAFKSNFISLLTSLISGCSKTIDRFIVGLVDRPQEPKERLYTVKQVSFTTNDGIELAGELTYPNGKGPFSAFVLVSGYGGSHEPADRDSYISEINHRPFLVLSDLMTKKGYAVLRYDNRGVGASGGSWLEATDVVYASDAAAALKWLKTQSDIELSAVGYIGHSQGGIKAPMAAQIEKPDFMIFLAGGVESTSEIIMNLTLDYAKQMKFSSDKTEKIQAQQNEIFNIMRSSENRHIAKSCIKKYALDQGKLANEAEQIAINSTLPVTFESLDRNWEEVIEQYMGPVLALYGGKDKSVVAERNIERTKAVLHNSKSKVKLFPNMNHLFQPAKKGGLEEYWEIETTFDENVADYMDSWLRNLRKQ